jgi:hypothetical protein
MTQQMEATAPSQTEVDDFWRRLREFSDSLSERERELLAMTVVAGAAWPVSTPIEEEKEQATDGAPADEELEAFAEKLDQFHDSLPGEQHQVLDGIVGMAYFSEEMDVQPYGWLFQGYIPANKLNYYKKLCWNYGGNKFYWSDPIAAGGKKFRKIGCLKGPGGPST